MNDQTHAQNTLIYDALTEYEANANTRRTKSIK